MTHHHDFRPIWHCECLLTDDRVRHASKCPRGRWLYVCRCGETGYAVREKT